jgi:hypothetical protein
MTRTTTGIFSCLTFLAAAAIGAHAQSSLDLEKFFRDNAGFSRDQIAAIRSGKAVAVALKSRVPAEVFVLGAVYVDADPSRYVEFAGDFDRLRKVPGYLAIGGIGDHPQLSDFRGFAFDADDIQALKNCKPADCDIQMPAGSIAALHQAIDWSAPNLAERINQRLQQRALELLLAYQRDGNRSLGVYNDKPDPTEVPKQFAYMLSYSKALPEVLPEFHRYLLDYPSAKPGDVNDSFYWSHVKFGLKPTLRVVHVITLRGQGADPMAYAIAEKQLYSSHYFQTALDLTFCVRDGGNPGRSGFYLIKAMGSEQAGLTGVKGSIVRKVAVDRSVSSLQKSLEVIKETLEGKP